MRYGCQPKNRVKTPKSSILIGFSIVNHPFWGTSIFGNIHMHYVWNTCRCCSHGCPAGGGNDLRFFPHCFGSSELEKTNGLNEHIYMYTAHTHILCTYDKYLINIDGLSFYKPNIFMECPVKHPRVSTRGIVFIDIYKPMNI